MRSIRRVVATALATLVVTVVGAAQAEIINGFHVVLSVNGNTQINVTGGGPNLPAQTSATRTIDAVTATIAADSNQYVSARADLSGSGNASARVTSSTRYSFHLEPPAGAPTVRGGKLILHVVLEGKASGNADLHLVSSVQADFGNGTGSVTVADATTGRAELDVLTEIAPFIEDISKANGTVRLALDARADMNGSTAASASATTGTRVTGFRVLDASGAQVKGFTMVAAGGNIPEATGGVPPGGTKLVAIEFYHAQFKHYFVSANPAEIAKLDNGTFVGWQRTGQSFNVYSNASSTDTPVCRFFTVAFPPTSSHFYAPRGLGCEGTLQNAKWQYEGDVFKVPLPDASGQCPAGSIPVYRLYNNGQGGAPNHRFTTSDATRREMLAQGFIAEGAGIGVGFCSPQ